MKTRFTRVVLAIVRKDLRAELRSRELLASMLLFTLLAILIFSFALELDRTARTEAVTGVLWVTLVFASILGLNRSISLEREQGNIYALLIAPVDRSAIYFGKFVGNLIFTLIVGLLMLPLMTILYNISILTLPMIALIFLGVVGICATGTLLATMTAQARAREALLPIALLPVVLPILLTAVRASRGILAGAPPDEWLGWYQILFGINLIYLVVCWLAFDYVVEE